MKTVMYIFFNWINDYQTKAKRINSQRDCDNAIVCNIDLKIDNVLWELVSIKICGWPISVVTLLFDDVHIFIYIYSDCCNLSWRL